MFLKRDAALPVLKLLRSAIANATHNFHLDPSMLIVKTISADGGATLKRMRPRAMGRSAPIRKRTTHIFMVLAAKTGAEQATVMQAESVQKTEAPVETSTKKKTRTRSVASSRTDSGVSKPKKS
jgi:large subunit ribosomal protein L22